MFLKVGRIFGFDIYFLFCKIILFFCCWIFKCGVRFFFEVVEVMVFDFEIGLSNGSDFDVV